MHRFQRKTVRPLRWGALGLSEFLHAECITTTEADRGLRVAVAKMTILLAEPP